MAKKAKPVPAQATQAAAQPVIDMSLMKAIGEAQNSAAQCLYVPANVSQPLVDAGLAMVNVDYKDAAGNLATRLTDAGIAKLEVPAAPVWGGQQQTVTAQDVGKLAIGPIVGGFKLETGVAVPERKAGFGQGGGQGRKSIYPFADMQIGQSFFVGPTADMPEPQKTLGSTVSSATLRYAEPVFDPDGKPKMVETMVAARDANGEIVKDGNGKIVRQKGLVQEKRQTRKFVIRGVTENGVSGARIWRTA